MESLAEDPDVPLMDRVYARYELEYRAAFGKRYVLHPENGMVVPLDMGNKQHRERQMGELAAASERVRAKARR